MVNSQKGISTIVVIIIVALVIIGVVVGFMLLSGTNQTPTSPQNESIPPTTKQETTPTVTEARVVEVTGGDFKFDPDSITVKKGERVKIVFTATDMQHDWVVEGMGVKTKVVKAGETTEVEFIPTESGEFEYFCSVGNHRAQGMVGKLIVTK